MSNWALIGLLALLIGSSQLGTSVYPGPNRSSGAKELCIAVWVLIAHGTLVESLTLPIETVEWDALPWISARAPIIQHDLVAGDCLAVSLGSSLVQLWKLGGDCLIFVALSAWLLSQLVRPGELARKQVQLTGNFWAHQFWETPKLVPVTVVYLYLLIRLLRVMLIA